MNNASFFTDLQQFIAEKRYELIRSNNVTSVLSLYRISAVICIVELQTRLKIVLLKACLQRQDLLAPFLIIPPEYVCVYVCMHEYTCGIPYDITYLLNLIKRTLAILHKCTRKFTNLATFSVFI